MAQYSSKDLIIAFDNSGGTPVTMTSYIREMGGIKISAIIQDSHTFGDTYFKAVSTGIFKMDKFSLRGYYDDTVTVGPNVIFNAPGNTTTRTITVTWGNSKTTAVETIIESYERTPKLADMTGFEVVLIPTGTITEA